MDGVMVKYVTSRAEYEFPEVGTRFRNRRSGVVRTVTAINVGHGTVQLTDANNRSTEKWLPHLDGDYEKQD
jgi:hypothetical protein